MGNVSGFGLTLWSVVVKTFVTDLTFSNLMLGVEKRKFWRQNFFQTVPEHISHGKRKKKFLLETTFLGKFK